MPVKRGMAVTNITPTISYTKDGTAGTVHPIPFKLLQASDLEMYVDGVLSADGFTVGGTLPDAATVVTTNDYTNGTKVTFKRVVAYEQQTTFAEGERYPGKRIENEFDNLAMQIQQVEEAYDRALKTNPGETPPGGTVPQSANTTLGQDANGDLVNRTAAEEVSFLGIADSVTAAAASAAAAQVSALSAEEQAGYANDERVLAEAAKTAAQAAQSLSSATLLDLSTRTFPKVRIGSEVLGTITSDVTLTFPGGGSITLKASARPYAEDNGLNAEGSPNAVDFLNDIKNIINGDAIDFDSSIEYGLDPTTTVSNYTPIPDWTAEFPIIAGVITTSQLDLTYYGSDASDPTIPSPFKIIDGSTINIPVDIPFVRLVDGKIPISLIPGATTTQLLAARTDITFIGKAGQSLEQGNTTSSAISTTNPDSRLISLNGGVKSFGAGDLVSFTPLVEDDLASGPNSDQSHETGAVVSGEKILSLVDADTASTTKQYLFQVGAVGSATLPQITPGNATDYYADYLYPAMVAAASIASASGQSIEMPAIIFGQGEQSTAESYRTTWKADLKTFRDLVQLDGSGLFTRQEPLKIIMHQSSILGSGAGGTTLGQVDAMKDFSWATIACPTYCIYALGGVTASVHPSSTGYAVMGAYKGKYLFNFLYGQEKPEPLRPLTAIVEDSVVQITFKVPVAPIVIDDSFIGSVTDAGIKVVDDSGTLTIDDMWVIGDNKLAFNVNRLITTNAKVRVGMDYEFAGSTINNGIATTIRDSDPDTVVVNSVTYDLHNYSISDILDLAADAGTQFPGTSYWVTRTNTTEAYQDRKASNDLTAIDAAPAFTGQLDSMVLVNTDDATDTSFDTGITCNGDTDSAWALVYFDATSHNSTTNSAIIINAQNGSFTADGFSIHLSRQTSGADLLHKITCYYDGDATVLYIDPDFVGWAVVGYSVDATNNNRKVWCSPLAANTNTSIVETSAISTYTPTSNLEIGRGSYTHSGSGKVDGAEVALVGYAPEYLDAAQIDSVIAHIEKRIGVTL